MNNKRTIPIFVPHSGCPNDCIFCNQKKITGVSSLVGPKEAEDTIVEALKTIPQNMDIEIAFFGGSFTAIEIEHQAALLDIANKYRKNHNITDIRLSTRPDAINQEILDFLKLKNVTIIELGVQSLDEAVLLNSNRGHNSKCVYESSELILKNGFKLGLQMMLGLPGDTVDKVIYTAEEFIKISPHFVRIYPVLVIKDTGLESLFKSKVYEPWSIEQTVETCKEIYVRFSRKGIKVIRIGLQTSEDITLGKDVVAGPFHPAIGELVYSSIFRDIIENVIIPEKLDYYKERVVTLKLNKKHISKVIGNKKSNKTYFKNNYNIMFNLEYMDSENTLVVDETVIDISFLK